MITYGSRTIGHPNRFQGHYLHIGRWAIKLGSGTEFFAWTLFNWQLTTAQRLALVDIVAKHNHRL